MNTSNKRMIITGLVALIVGGIVGAGVVELKASGSSKTVKATGDQVSASNGVNLGVTADAWDPFQQIRAMQMQMDKMFGEMSDQFHTEPQFSGLSDNPGYSLSLNVEELKDRYVVHALLPDTKVSDVNVKLENQTLKVEVSNKQSQSTNKKTESTSMTEWGQYEQMIQLPGPVKSDQMKIERKDHELLITLPKAK
jgi:HSP20 family molecular chaperone IbpA